MKKINLIKLIITVFVISWIGVLPSLLLAYNIDIPNFLKHLEHLMTLGPILGAIIFVYKAQGKQGLKNLFKRLIYIKAKPIVIAIAVLSPIVYSYLAAKIGFMLSDSEWPSSFNTSTIISNGIMIFVMYLIVNTEEIAWRGVVFDKLFKKYNFLKACSIIAPIWWLFHIPLFLFPDGHPGGYGILGFTIIVIAQTIILGWIYVNSNRSLFYTHIHHQLINGFGQAFPIFPALIGDNMLPFWCFVTIMLLIAFILLIIMLKESKMFKPKTKKILN